MRAKHVLFSIVAILLFFGVVEAALYLASVPTLLSERDPFQGFSSEVRAFSRDDAKGLYRTPPRAVRHSFNYQEFKIRKPEGGYRVFTLGDSSAYGFPWGGGVAFSRLLGAGLAATFRDREVEAVNAAAMSYGSYRLRVLEHEILDYEPDTIVIYNGHNEFVERGFYRAIVARTAPLDGIKKVLARWRLYSALTRLYERSGSAEREAQAARGSGGRSTGELLGLDVVRETSADVGEAERSEVAKEFEENTRAILEAAKRAGVRVVLCTVPSNLSGWVPNQSVFGAATTAEDRARVQHLVAEGHAAIERGDPEAAVRPLEAARGIDAGYAETHYRLGQAYQGISRFAEAKESYVRARDLDAKPTRASSRFNEAVRRLAAEQGATLVDVERDFEQASPHGIVGFDLIEDYVHPKPEGHRRIALALYRAFVEEGLVGARAHADPALFERAVASLPPAPAEATPALLYNLAVVLENQDRVDEAIEKYRACLARDPSYLMARYNLALLLHRKGRFEEAALESRRVLESDPGFVRAMLSLGEALRRLGRLDQALAAFSEATRADPRLAPAWDGLGGTLTQLGRLAEAEEAFRRAVAADPSRPEYRANLGLALLFRRDLVGAEETLRTGLAAHPGHTRTRDALGAVLTEKGAFDEAERLFRESLRLDPTDASARAGLEILARRRAGGR
jgi:tetratricopeptide (TPR) repeat protein